MRLALKSVQPDIPQIDAFVGTRPIEKTNALKVYDYGPSASQSEPERVRVADILIPDCKAGDIFQGNGSVQATSELSYAVEFTASLRATQSPTSIQGDNLDAEHGYNISPQTAGGQVWHGLHHGPLSLSGAYAVPQDGDWYVMIVAYGGGSSLTSDPYDWLALDPIGDLSVVRIRP